MAASKKIAKKKTAKKRTVKKAPVKRTTSKPKFLVKDKKELLEKLLQYEQEQEKIDKSQKVLWDRGERLEAKRKEAVRALVDGIELNKEDIDVPILYKNKSFQIDDGDDWLHSVSVIIKSIKKL